MMVSMMLNRLIAVFAAAAAVIASLACIAASSQMHSSPTVLLADPDPGHNHCTENLYESYECGEGYKKPLEAYELWKEQHGQTGPTNTGPRLDEWFRGLLDVVE
ncbi:hypothetical protein M2432_004903 [Mycobacterium sp. OTB74]|jgi:hypothetical protein|nr:hypothetical protein [Mycobacterium sp. OTB74]